MARNGHRKQPRPRIELTTPAASPQEAAAIATAIERFLAETAPAPATASEPASPWQRAALVDGVRARSGLGPAWGGGPAEPAALVRERAAI